MSNQTSSKDPQWTILNILNWTTPYFESHDIDSPRICAELLLAHVLNVKRIDLYLRYDQPLLPEELAKYKKLIKRRIQREPAAYILGTKEFWSMELIVTPDVLIPRPETECLVELALMKLEAAASDSPLCVLDLGTGSGAIVIALASQLAHHQYFASDISHAAIQIARKNAIRHGLKNHISFFVGNWLQPLKDTHQKFDMIVSNPPYISRRQMGGLQPEIVEFEPVLALDGMDTGLACVAKIIDNAHCHLKSGGNLILEIGYDQAEMVAQMLRHNGNYTPAVVKKDYSGHDRVVQVQRT